MGRDGGRVVGEHAAKPFAVARPLTTLAPLIPFVSNFMAFVTALLLLYNI